MSERALSNAALQWHAAHERRLAIGKYKRKLDAQIKAGGDCGWSLQRSIEQSEAGRQLTEARRRELAAMRALARACAAQRGHLDLADVVLDCAVRLLAGADDQLLA